MAKSKAKKLVEPVKPVKSEGRICFGIVWLKSENDAQKYAEFVKQRGDTYNGGWYDGFPCGRTTAFDYVDSTHGQLYAVTVS